MCKRAKRGWSKCRAVSRQGISVGEFRRCLSSSPLEGAYPLTPIASNLCSGRVLVMVVRRLPLRRRLSRIEARRNGRRVLDELYGSWSACIELHGYARVMLCGRIHSGAHIVTKLASWCGFGGAPYGSSLIGLCPFDPHVITTGTIVNVNRYGGRPCVCVVHCSANSSCSP